MEEATLKIKPFESIFEGTSRSRAWWMCEHCIIKGAVLIMAEGHHSAA